MMRLDRRPALDSDIAFLLALRRETMDVHLAASGASTAEAFHLAWVMHHFDCAQILLCDGEPVGLLKLRRLPGAWEIVQVPLGSPLQGRGFGRNLREEVLAEAALDRVPVKLSVLKANPARKLYERLGFKFVGQDAHEYFMQHDP